jgi:hypothetical protein
MGMDVYGLKPKTTVGEYFRNSIWYWHPLWDYCCFIDKTLIEKVPNAHSNDGDGLNAVESRQLGFKIAESIESGVAANYILAYNDHLKSLQKEPCHCTKSSQFQTITTALEDFLKSIDNCLNLSANTSSSLQQSYDPNGPIPFPKQESQPIKEDCASCQGTGLVQNFMNNITLFSKFLIDCGGFQIC